jgi:hypothetical protein
MRSVITYTLRKVELRMKWAENITRMGGDLKGVPSRGFLRRHAVKC